MLAYVASPIDLTDHGSPNPSPGIVALHTLLSEVGYASFTPAMAWTSAKGGDHSAEHVIAINEHALNVADLFVGIVLGRTVGVPMEFQTALRLGIPTAIITDRA